MLKSLRKKKMAKFVWIILAIIVIPAFVLWGASGVTRSKEESAYLGKIFGKKVTLLELQDAISAVRNQAIMEYGDNSAELEKINFEYQAWQRLLLLAEAKRRKIKVSDAEVTQLVQGYPLFSRKGRFDNATYERMLQYVFGTQAREFEEQVRQNLKAFKLFQDITGDIKVGDEETKKEYQKLNEQISIYYLVALFNDFKNNIISSEEEIKDYFTNNPFEFKQPLSFNLEYVIVESGADEKDKETAEGKIKEIFQRLNKKEDFSKIMQDYNLTMKETGLFGQTDSIPGIGWSPQILSLLNKAQINQLLPPLVIDKSYYLIKLKEKKEPYIPDFETIKDKVKDALISNKAQKSAREKIQDCLEKLKSAYQANPKGTDFEKIGASCNLKTGSTDLFKFGSYIEGIGSSDNFFQEAQKLKEDEFSEILSGPSGFYIIKVKSKIPIDEKKFAEEKGLFQERLLLQRKEEYFGKFMQELKGRAQ